jgi:phosphatidylglycerol---prolipoprotein diacylglyceryl transferase
MTMLLAEINWNASPYIFKLGSFEFPWYGLLFASGFLLGYPIMARIFKTEGKPETDLDALLMTMIIATVIGARFGHFFFYETQLLNENPGKFFIEMIIPPYRGLASHGAAFGIVVALWLYARKRADQPYLWVTDRMVIPAALGGAFIRLGNLMNHEIVGKQSDLPWAFRFNEFRLQNGEVVGIPEDFARHPAQLYESLSCFVLFLILYFLWNKWKANTPRGSLTGLFFIWIFGLRFFYEFIKENQEAFEETMTYNMGQLLSIPLVIFGLIVFFRSFRKPSAV